MDEQDPQLSPTRRRFFRVALIPVAAVALPGCSDHDTKGGTTAATTGSATTPAGPYQATFFNVAEMAFVTAACRHMIPTDELGPGAVEAGVPEFLDRHMKTPYAAGDIWYMQGPYLEASPQFGYQGRLPLRDILRVGIKSFDAHCTASFGGKTFAQLDQGQQLQLLKAADTGKLKIDDIPAKTFFDYLLNEVKAGYFADPSHGGNKDMIGWKAIDYPGMRADYIDWVGVRDQRYPLPPVNLAGQRA